jgi:hypothetical protein
LHISRINICVVVGSDEDAVLQLACYFDSVIDSLVSLTFEHYATPKKKSGKGPGYFNHEKLEKKKKVLDRNPECFLLQPSSLQVRLTECRDTIIVSFRKFDFGVYTPVISHCFGAAAVLDPGSGIDFLLGQPVDPRS